MFEQLEKILLLKTDLKKTSHLIGKSILLMVFFQIVATYAAKIPILFFTILGNFILFTFLWYMNQKSFNICFSTLVIFSILFCLFLKLNLLFLFSLISVIVIAFTILYFSKNIKDQYLY